MATENHFVKGVSGSGLALVTQHYYVGGNPLKRGINTSQAIDNMLSREWVASNYPQLYNSVLKPVAKAGLPFPVDRVE